MDKKDKKPYLALVPYLVTGVIWILGAIILPVHKIGILLLVFGLGAVAFVIASYGVSKKTHMHTDVDFTLDEQGEAQANIEGEIESNAEDRKAASEQTEEM